MLSYENVVTIDSIIWIYSIPHGLWSSSTGNITAMNSIIHHA